MKLKLYFADSGGKRISNENLIIADSTSREPRDRTYREKITLKDMAYDKSQTYYLILEDEDEPVEKSTQRSPSPLICSSEMILLFKKVFLPT